MPDLNIPTALGEMPAWSAPEISLNFSSVEKAWRSPLLPLSGVCWRTCRSASQHTGVQTRVLAAPSQSWLVLLC